MRPSTDQQRDEHLPTPEREATVNVYDTPPGWRTVEEIHLPNPTYWPAVLALAITFIAWGILTSLWITLVGFILFALAIGGWIGDLLHEH